MGKPEGIRVSQRTIGRRKAALNLRFVSGPETDAKPIRVAVANGAFYSYPTFGPIIERTVQLAHAAGRPIQAVMCDDPWRRDAYSPQTRQARLRQTVEYLTDHNQGEVGIVGHSWGWPRALAVAHELPHEIAFLDAYEPVGHQKTKGKPVSWESIVHAALTEASQVKAKTLLRNPRCVTALGIAAVGRTWYSNALNESLRAYTVDATPAVVAWQDQYKKPVGMAIPAYDAFFRPPEDEAQLLRDSGVDIQYIPTTHLGAVIDKRYRDALFNLINRADPDRARLAPGDPAHQPFEG
jgi:hypothetical protein